MAAVITTVPAVTTTTVARVGTTTTTVAHAGASSIHYDAIFTAVAAIATAVFTGTFIVVP